MPDVLERLNKQEVVLFLFIFLLDGYGGWQKPLYLESDYNDDNHKPLAKAFTPPLHFPSLFSNALPIFTNLMLAVTLTR